MHDDLGDRIKLFETEETNRRFDKTLPLYARLDGRGFSKFTKNMQRPYDADMGGWMIETTKHLVNHTHATIGFTQSDEVSLVWSSCNDLEQFMFNGKHMKLTSVLAGMTTAKFVSMLPNDLKNQLPHFDCRIFNLPSTTEAVNALIWRENDARKNSVSMLARTVFSHTQLHKKSSSEMKQMMAEKNIFLADYPIHFQQGAYLTRETAARFLNDDELVAIPKHKRPMGPVIRSQIVIKERLLVEMEHSDRLRFVFGDHHDM